LEGIADEIIVVDSFSTDATQEICQQYGVRFVQRHWQGYSNQKNYAHSLASYQLILSLDADEMLSEELKASIRAVNPTWPVNKRNYFVTSGMR
jgi:(heptosyl)LPS beta-1,4-glucosyltransferase